VWSLLLRCRSTTTRSISLPNRSFYRHVVEASIACHLSAGLAQGRGEVAYSCPSPAPLPSAEPVISWTKFENILEAMPPGSHARRVFQTLLHPHSDIHRFASAVQAPLPRHLSVNDDVMQDGHPGLHTLRDSNVTAMVSLLNSARIHYIFISSGRWTPFPSPSAQYALCLTVFALVFLHSPEQWEEWLTQSIHVRS